MKNDADPRAHPWQKDAIKYANGQGERDAEISCARIRPSTLSTSSPCTARPIGERVVHKLSILRPLSFRSFYMLDPFVCTPLFLPSAARPHGNEAKNPDFFLTRCIFLPSFLTSCLLASILEIAVTQGCLGRPSDLRPCKLSLHTIKKKESRQKIVRKFSARNIQMSFPKAASCILFWDTLCGAPKSLLLLLL